MFRTLTIAALFVVAAMPLGAQVEDCAELAGLRALYDVRQLMLSPYPDSYGISRRIEQHLDWLRGPLPEGGYRWVRYVRPAGDGPVVKRDKLVRADHSTEELETFEAEAPAPYAVRVVVPRKRSLTKANNDVWVESVTIRTWRDGERVETEKRIGQWLKPDNSRTFDLEGIVDRAEVSVEAATAPAWRGQALVEVHFRQAVAQDDPANPNFETVRALDELRIAADPATLDLEIARLEQRLFPGVAVTPFTTIVHRLRQAEALIRSEKEEERLKGEKELAELMRTLPR